MTKREENKNLLMLIAAVILVGLYFIAPRGSDIDNNEPVLEVVDGSTVGKLGDRTCRQVFVTDPENGATYTIWVDDNGKRCQ